MQLYIHTLHNFTLVRQRVYHPQNPVINNERRSEYKTDLYYKTKQSWTVFNLLKIHVSVKQIDK